MSSLEEDWDAAPSQAGNIDLNARPVVKNGDGSISTVRSMSANIDGKEVLIPTVAEDGSGILSDDKAVEQYRRTGKHLGMFDSPAAATAYAQRLHEDQANLYGNEGQGGLESDWDAAPDPMEGKKQDLATAFAASIDKSPERLAQVLPIADKLGLPQDTVDRNLDWLKREDEIQSFRAPAFIRNNPALANLMLDERPEAVSMVVRDEHVNFLAQAMRALITPFESPEQGEVRKRYEAGELDYSGYTAELQKAKGISLEQFFPEPKKVAYRSSPLADAEGLDRVAILGRVWDQSRVGAQRNSAWSSYIAAKVAGQDPEPYRVEAERLEKDLAPEWYGDLNPLERIATDVVQAAGSQVEQFKGMGAGAAAAAVGAVALTAITKGKVAPALGRSLLIGSKIGSAAASFDQEMGSGYAESRNEKLPDGSQVTEEAAIGMAIVRGAVNAGIEVLNIGPLAEGYKPLKDALAKKGAQNFVREMLTDRTAAKMLGDIGKAWLKSGATEGAEGFAQSLSGSLFDYLAKRISASQYGQDGSNIPVPGKEAFIKAVGEGQSEAIGGLALGGAQLIPAVVSVGFDARARSQAAAAVNKVQLVNDAAKQSPSVKAIPQVIARMITDESAASGEAITHMHVDPGAFVRLFQSNNADPNAGAVEMLGEDGAADLGAALHTDGKISIPIEDYLRKWAGTPLAEALQGDTTTRSFHQTANQMQAREQANVAEAERLADEHLASEERKAKGEAVADKAETDLMNVGFSGQTAKMSALPLREFLRVQIEQNFPNADPEQLLNAAVSVRQGDANAPAEGQRLNQAAFHGSPHQFDRFSIDKIGTGEGNQSFGYGLYFAGNRKIAEHYRETLSNARPTLDGKELDQLSGEEKAALTSVLHAVENQGLGPKQSLPAALESAKQRAAKEIRNAEVVLKEPFKLTNLPRLDEAVQKDRLRFQANKDHWEKQLPLLESWTADRLSMKGGQLYEVDVPEDSELLDYDTPLHKQPEKVQQAMKAINPDLLEQINDFMESNGADITLDDPDITGRQIYQALAKFAGEGVLLEKTHIDASPEQATSEFLNSLGIPGLRFLDASSRKKGDGTRNYVVWDDARVQVKKKHYQGEDTKRGYVEFGQEGAKRLFNVLLDKKNANLATFLHESGHVILEMMGDLASREDAPERLKEDWAKVLEYLGVKDRSEITDHHHEVFARSLEAYLREGNSPSAKLTRAFTRFKLWLKEIYRSVAQLDVELSDEVRGVFDRLFATDAEIEKALRKTPPLYRTPAEAERGGIPAAEYPAYLKAQERAVSNATRRVELRMLKDQLQETQGWWKEQEAKLVGEALAEFDQRNDAKADRYIRKGELPLEDGRSISDSQMGRLDREKVYDLVGKERAKAIGHRLLKDIGEDPDDVAKLFGFTGGRHLVEAVLRLPDRQAWAKDTARDRMLDQHPDIAQDQALLEQEVQKGLHGDHTADWLVGELEALDRTRGQPTPPKASIRLAAKLIVDRTQVGRLGVGQALNAERAAASKAAVAAASGDYGKAAVHKQQQLLNHYLWRELQDAKEDRGRFEKLTEKADSAEARGQLGLGGEELLGANDQLLGALGLSSPKPGEQPPAPGAFGQAVERIGRERLVPGFDAELMKDIIAKPRPWQQLRVDEMREVSAALQQLRQIAISARNVRLLAREIRIEDLIQAVDVESARLPKTTPGQMDDTRKGSRQRLGDWTQRAYAGLRDPEDLISRLGKVAHDFFMKGYLAARTAEDELSKKVLGFFEKHWDNLPKEMQRRRYDVVDPGNLAVPEGLHIGGQVSRQWMWMVALNMGNESNKERLLGGFQWQERDALSFLNKNMTAEEWRFVQGVWDMMDTVLWPEVAKAYQAINGIPPKKIASTPIVTPHGTFNGGYFPAKYRNDITRIGAIQDNAAVEQLYSGPGTSASVAKGFTKERVKGFKEVIDLNWGVVPGHVAQVIHYATHDAFVRDAARVFYSSEMSALIQKRLGKGYQEQLEGFLKAIANGAAGSAAAEFSWIYQGLNFFKQRFVLSAIGFSLKSAAGGLANPFVVMGSGELSSFYGTTSYMGFIYRYRSMRKEALERSPELRNRTKGYAQELRRQLADKGATGQRGRWGQAMHQIREFGGIFEETVDQITSTVVWEGGYREALGKGMDDAAAVQHADALVRRNFVSKNVAEQPSLLRDKRTVGAIVSFFSYFSKLSQTHFRIIDRFNDARYEGKATAGSVRAAAQFLATSVAAFGLSEALSGNGPEKDEDLAEWFRRRMLTSPWSMVPIFGEFAAKSGAAVEDKISGTKRGYRPNPRVAPAAAGAQRLYDQGAKVFNAKKSDGERAIAAFDVLLTALGIPGAGALGRAANYVREVDEGKAGTDARLQLGDEKVTIPGGAIPGGLIYGPPK